MIYFQSLETVIANSETYNCILNVDHIYNFLQCHLNCHSYFHSFGTLEDNSLSRSIIQHTYKYKLKQRKKSEEEEELKIKQQVKANKYSNYYNELSNKSIYSIDVNNYHSALKIIQHKYKYSNTCYKYFHKKKLPFRKISL